MLDDPPVMTGLYPKAILRLIPPGDNDPPITPRLAILHVDAGDAFSLFDFFSNRSGGIESHFHVRKDGEVEQYRDIFRQADANLDANDFAVSIETQGLGPGHWNDEQLQAITELLLWLHEEAGIPLRKVESWDGAGVGYHTLFGAPSHWTPEVKTCPGPARIVQFNSVLVPWMAQATAPAPVEQSPTKVELARAALKAAIRKLRKADQSRAAVAKATRKAQNALKTLPKK